MTVHVIGAGVAGLSAAVRLVEAGRPVALYEATGQAGGRCRSLFDERLGVEIDNGNHLLLSGNTSAMNYLAAIDAADSLAVAPNAAIPFVDLDSGESWVIQPNTGLLPWWIFARNRRAPATRAGEYLSALRLAVVPAEATVASLFGGRPELLRRFWQPLTVAVLNTAPHEASAALLRPLLTEIWARGAAAARPCIARRGLSHSFIDPALAWLARRGAAIRCNERLRAIDVSDNRATGLHFASMHLELDPDDRVVLAVPPSAAAALLPDIPVPDESRAIVNLHFRLDRAAELPGGHFLLGLVGGTAQWVFARGQVLSVTISAAEREVELSAEVLIATVWSELCQALGLGQSAPPLCRVLKEKRATFAQTPAQVRRRARTTDGPENVALAGDWTDTGLPATIEGAIRSGENAARFMLRDQRLEIRGQKETNAALRYTSA